MDALNEDGITVSAAPSYGPTTTWEVLRAVQLDPPSFCHENNTMYEPIDMNYSMTGSSRADIEACQMLCRNIDACGYYTWYESLKSCHLALPTAQKVTGRRGFQAGPAACDEAQQGADSDTVKTEMMKDQCLVTNQSFYPLQSRGRAASTATDPVDCQNQCKNVSWCAHFVYNTLLKICNLQDSDAVASNAAVYQIAGPPSCGTQIQLDITFQEKGGSQKTMHDLLANKVESAIFFTIVKSAISTFAGNFTPYLNGKAHNTTQLLAKSDMTIDVKDAGDEDPEQAVLTVTMDVIPLKMFYISQLIDQKGAMSGLDKQITRFVQYLGGQFSSSIAAMEIHVTQFSNVTHKSNAGSFVKDQQAAFANQTVQALAKMVVANQTVQAFKMAEPVEGSAVSDVTKIVTVVTAAIFIVLLASYVALSRSTQRYKTGHCQVIEEADDARTAMVLLPGAEDDFEVTAAGEIA